MAYDVEISSHAAIELEEAIDWYHKISPDLAADLFNKYLKAREALAARPLLYRQLRKGYRKVVLKRFPYKMIFKVIDEKTILILAFAHHKQRNYWKRR